MTYLLWRGIPAPPPLPSSKIIPREGCTMTDVATFISAITVWLILMPVLLFPLLFIGAPVGALIYLLSPASRTPKPVVVGQT